MRVKVVQVSYGNKNCIFCFHNQELSEEIYVMHFIPESVFMYSSVKS